MLSEAQRFWEAIAGKVKQMAKEVSKNAFRCERYTVTTAPNGVKMGVTLPMGNTELMLPYSSEVASATVGDTVLVVWWGSMSNAKVYYYADGYNGVDINSVVTSVNGQTGAVSIDPERIGAMAEWDLLWENASPTSSFAAQTLNISLTNYDLVLCVFRNASLDSWVSVIIPVGVQGMLIVPHESASGGNFFRSFYPTTSGIDIGNGTTGGIGTNNANNVPRLIYGIKGVNNS